MASSDPLLEAECFEKMADSGERNVRVGRAEKHPFEQTVCACYPAF
jgi:hypothetical protein